MDGVLQHRLEAVNHHTITWNRMLGVRLIQRSCPICFGENLLPVSLRAKGLPAYWQTRRLISTILFLLLHSS